MQTLIWVWVKVEDAWDRLLTSPSPVGTPEEPTNSPGGLASRHAGAAEFVIIQEVGLHLGKWPMKYGILRGFPEMGGTLKWSKMDEFYGKKHLSMDDWGVPLLGNPHWGESTSKKPATLLGTARNSLSFQRSPCGRCSNVHPKIVAMALSENRQPQNVRLNFFRIQFACIPHVSILMASPRPSEMRLPRWSSGVRPDAQSIAWGPSAKAKSAKHGEVPYMGGTPMAGEFIMENPINIY